MDLIERQVRFLDQDPLQGHRVAAALSGLEKITITKPLPLLKRNLVGIILPLKGYCQGIDLDPLSFCGILF